MATRRKISKEPVGVNGRGLTTHSRDPSADRVDRGRPRSGLEIPRKLFHSSISIATAYLWLSHPDVQLILRVASIGLACVVILDILRFRYPKLEYAYESVVGLLMRESERFQVNGVIYYLLGVIICCALYPRDIATLSIIILSLCDTTASVFGRLFGKSTGRLPLSGLLFGAKKSIAGTIAAILTGSLASYYFWTQLAIHGDESDSSWHAVRVASTWSGPAPASASTIIPRLPSPDCKLGPVELAVVNGIVAGFAEAIELFGLDDNLTLPVLFGAGCWAVMTVFS